MRFVPYAVGLFMLTPLVLWAGLWLFAFPGIKSGFDVPLVVSLFLVSVPVVITFLITNTAFIANSMAGRNEFGPPAWRPARALLAVQPSAAVLIGAAAAPYLLSVGEPWYVVPIPLATGVCFAIAIRRSIVWREADPPRAAGTPAAAPRDLPTAAPAPTAVRSAVAAAPTAPPVVAAAPAAPRRRLREWVFAIPVFGWMLRELIEDYAQERLFFAFNVVALWLGAVVLFGLPIIFYTALALVPVVFTFIIMTTRD